ncbi:MAG: 50S ribosomal protein L11 methyltransferase [Clostridiales bacterium]|nr:50S ribosomal protein L11 methyltransferase [Clostridiales bacterium]MDY2836302.1 50S ribosomal protein L11 methyltransferase [Candidatus Aphodomonas sp.]
MDWLEVTVRTNTAGADLISELLISAGAKGTSIEDRFDAFSEPTDATQWDLIDPSVIEKMDEDTLVHAYFPAETTSRETIESLRARLAALTPEWLGFDAGKRALEIANVREEDWAENWKKYYKPFRVGRHLVVRPVWEKYEPQAGDKIISIDPGMAFGNGTHETTSMCLGLVEDYIKPGDTVLDVGTGSGILAIASVLMGAQSALGIDLDPVAVRVANENIERNGLSGRVHAQVGDLVKGIDTQADVVFANIIADAVILLSRAVRAHMKPGGVFICSGIILEREQDVLDALAEAGFTVDRIEHRGEWSAIAAR